MQAGRRAQPIWRWLVILQFEHNPFVAVVQQECWNSREENVAQDLMAAILNLGGGRMLPLDLRFFRLLLSLMSFFCVFRILRTVAAMQLLWGIFSELAVI